MRLLALMGAAMLVATLFRPAWASDDSRLGANYWRVDPGKTETMRQVEAGLPCGIPPWLGQERTCTTAYSRRPLLLVADTQSDNQKDEWPKAQPCCDRPALDLKTVAGYWRRIGSDDSDMLYLSPDGILDAQIWKDGDISYFVGRWKPVQEIAPRHPAIIHQMLMATDEKYCSDGKHEDFQNFRLLEVDSGRAGPVIQIDYAIGIKPPPDPLTIPNETLWLMFREEARRSNYKGEGMWAPIADTDVPPWFRQLVARTVAARKFRCADQIP